MNDTFAHSNEPASSAAELAERSHEQNPNFYEIETELKEALALAETATDADVQLIVQSYLTAADYKRDRMTAVIRRLEAEQEICEQEIRRFRARKDAVNNAERRLKGYVIAVMQSIGETKLKGNTSTLTIQRSPAHVEILEPTLIPAEYKIIRYEIDRIKLRGDLKHGKEVPGAELVDNQVYLRIR